MYPCAGRSGATVTRCPRVHRKGRQLLKEQQQVKIAVKCRLLYSQALFLIWPIRLPG